MTEAVRISREAPQNLLNNKLEFTSNNLAELTIQYGDRVYRGNGIKRKRDHQDDEDYDDEEEDQDDDKGISKNTVPKSQATNNNSRGGELGTVISPE